MLRWQKDRTEEVWGIEMFGILAQVASSSMMVLASVPATKDVNL